MAYEALGRGKEIFSALADRTRIRIVRLLYAAEEPTLGEMAEALSQSYNIDSTFYCEEATVCELVDALRLPQYSVSRHLSILRNAGIVRERREGVWKYYSIISLQESFAGKILALSLTGLNEKILERDLLLFRKRLALRVNGKCVIGFD